MGLQFLMLEPNADDPLNKEAAAMLSDTRGGSQTRSSRPSRAGPCRWLASDSPSPSLSRSLASRVFLLRISAACARRTRAVGHDRWTARWLAWAILGIFRGARRRRQTTGLAGPRFGLLCLKETDN